jgi:hypothetical protein
MLPNVNMLNEGSIKADNANPTAAPTQTPYWITSKQGKF